jgi:hypothetical protein
MRPVGVTLIGGFELFISSLLLVLAITAFLGFGVLSAILGSTARIGGPAMPFLAGAGIVTGCIVLVPSALFGLLGWNLLRMREWARMATFVLGSPRRGRRCIGTDISNCPPSAVFHYGYDDTVDHEPGNHLVSESTPDQAIVQPQQARTQPLAIRCGRLAELVSQQTSRLFRSMVPMESVRHADKCGDG